MPRILAREYCPPISAAAFARAMFSIFSSEIHLDCDFCHAQAVLALTPVPLWAFRWPGSGGRTQHQTKPSPSKADPTSVSRFEWRRLSSTHNFPWSGTVAS